jgi:hypothetical protein
LRSAKICVICVIRVLKTDPRSGAKRNICGFGRQGMPCLYKALIDEKGPSVASVFQKNTAQRGKSNPNLTNSNN